MDIIALLTGKRSSTMANKNILPVFKRPLLSYPAEAARRSKNITSFYVSSEDVKILEIAGKCGYKKILRPKYLAKHASKHGDVIIHALNEIKKRDNFIPNILVVLMANTAAIKTEWIDACIKIILNNKNISAVIPVCEDSDHHPYRAKKIGAKGFLEPFFDFKGKNISTNRQELESSYFLCHNFWVLNIKKSVFSKIGQQPWAFMGNNIMPFIVESCCDVHTKEDLIRTEQWLRRNFKRKWKRNY